MIDPLAARSPLLSIAHMFVAAVFLIVTSVEPELAIVRVLADISP